MGDGRLPSAQQEHQKALQDGLTGAQPMPLGEARHVPRPRACVMNERGERCASNSGLPLCEWWVRQAACVRKAPARVVHTAVTLILSLLVQGKRSWCDTIALRAAVAWCAARATAPESQCTVGGEVWRVSGPAR